MCGQDTKITNLKCLIVYVVKVSAVILHRLMDLKAVLVFTVVLTGGQLATSQNSTDDSHCPKNFECVPFSKCKSLDTKSVVYPCVIADVNMLCCPVHGTPEPALIQRSSAFPDKCGEYSLNDRIIGGKNADLGEFPFMALLGYNRTDILMHFNHSDLVEKSIPFVQFLCGGSILTQKYVLTAAHCIILDKKLTLSTVRVGELNLTSEIDCVPSGGDEPVCGDPYVDLAVEKTVHHAGYNTDTLKNDIALVKLKSGMTFTDYIQPICLPFGKRLQTKSLDSASFEVSGWGKTSTGNLGGSTSLQYTKVKVWNIFRCNNAVPPEVKPIQNTQLCANGQKAEDACKGDSGGPLFNRTIEGNKGKTYQIGIVSFGAARACGNKELPTVYTRIDGYLEWITDNVK